MSLAEYRVSDAVDVSLVDPFAARLLGLLEHFGGRVLIVSGRRSWGEQQVLWLAYLAGGNLAARPGTSNHEHGVAADLRIVGDVTWRTVHAEAEIRGLRFPLPGEAWHVEVDPAWQPLPEEPEDMAMSDDDMRKLAGFIAEALDARPRQVYAYDQGVELNTTAKALEEYAQMELQQIRRK